MPPGIAALGSGPAAQPDRLQEMRILYKPFAIIAGVIGSKLGKRAFQSLWSKIDDDEPPGATAPSASLAKVVGAAVLKAATLAGVAAAVDRVSAMCFHYLTGIWPGEKPAEKSAAERSENGK